MKHQKPLAVRIFIRICVVIVTISLVWVYITSMIGGGQQAEDNQWAEVDTWAVEDMTWSIDELTWTVEVSTWDLDELTWENIWTAEENIISLEIDPENPENTGAPILVTEDGEVDEMDQTFEVQLENGETEVVRQWDLSDAIQLAQ